MGWTELTSWNHVIKIIKQAVFYPWTVLYAIKMGGIRICHSRGQIITYWFTVWIYWFVMALEYRHWSLVISLLQKTKDKSISDRLNSHSNFSTLLIHLWAVCLYADRAELCGVPIWSLPWPADASCEWGTRHRGRVFILDMWWCSGSVLTFGYSAFQDFVLWTFWIYWFVMSFCH